MPRFTPICLRNHETFSRFHPFFHHPAWQGFDPSERGVDRHRRCISAYRLLRRNPHQDPAYRPDGPGWDSLQKRLRHFPGLFVQPLGHGERHVPDHPWSTQPPQPDLVRKRGGQRGLLRKLRGTQVGHVDPRALPRRRVFRHQQEQDRLQLHPDEQALSRQRLEEGACRPTHLRPIPTQWRKEPQSEKPCRSRQGGPAALLSGSPRPSPGLGQVFGLLGKNR